MIIREGCASAMAKLLKIHFMPTSRYWYLYARLENEFISLTDIARYKSDDPTAVIQNWMRNRDVIEFLGLWERLHNPDFKPLEFEGFRKQAGANAFTMSPRKWIDATNAIGIVSKSDVTVVPMPIVILRCLLLPGYHPNSSYI